MRHLALWTIALTCCLVWSCKPDDSSNNNNGGWLDTSIDGEDDTGDDTADDTEDDVGEDTDDSDATAPHWSDCAVPSNCVLRANTCCGVCGQPELSDMDAVNEDRVDAHYDDVCPDPGPCPDCVQEYNPYLIASCQEQTCTGYDVRQEAFTECSVDSDCKLRTRECCECGGTTEPHMLIAVAKSGELEYRELVCDPDTDCPECLPVYPDNAEAVCNDAGHCEVEVTQQ